VKIAVVGDRNFDHLKYGRILDRSVGELLREVGCFAIITGDAAGVDAWARSHYNKSCVTVYCASDDRCALLTSEGYSCVSVSDWKRNGKAAGPIRNGRVIADSDRVILVDGGGPGSADIAKKCAKFPTDRFIHLKLVGCECLNADDRCEACSMTGTIVALDGRAFWFKSELLYRCGWLWFAVAVLRVPFPDFCKTPKIWVE
jgi:hypothetical protein